MRHIKYFICVRFHVVLRFLDIFPAWVNEGGLTFDLDRCNYSRQLHVQTFHRNSALNASWHRTSPSTSQFSSPSWSSLFMELSSTSRCSIATEAFSCSSSSHRHWRFWVTTEASARRGTFVALVLDNAFLSRKAAKQNKKLKCESQIKRISGRTYLSCILNY